MALFSFKKGKEKKGETGKKNSASHSAEKINSKKAIKAPEGSFAPVLIRPRVTEKVTFLAERNNVYTFDVIDTATKKTVIDAVRSAYKITPIKVSIVTMPRKRVFVRGKRGVKRGGRKAYIYLKSGDKIQTS